MKTLVTGGAGFLGRAIVKQLLEQDHQVAVLVRRDVPELEKLGVEVRRADLRDEAAVARAMVGIDWVFHVAAKAGIWGPYQEYYQSNVTGTRNVLHGCLKYGIEKLIYTSSPSVTFKGMSTPGVDESIPYPDRFLNAYSATKAEAEKMVLEADSHDDLLTVALRPHIIWGPGDPHIIPRLVNKARQGQLMRVGAGDNLVDITYVDNAARAHILAAEALEDESPVRGRAFFISQGEPVKLWSWINDLLQRLEIPAVKRSVPLPLARLLGAALELIYRAFKISGEPRMTRFLAAQLGTSHYYDISAARELLGYQPQISTAEGLDVLVDWLQTQQQQ